MTWRRGMCEDDEGAVAAELEATWGGAGYHGFGVCDGGWAAVSEAGEVLDGKTPADLERAIGEHWSALVDAVVAADPVLLDLMTRGRP